MPRRTTGDGWNRSQGFEDISSYSNRENPWPEQWETGRPASSRLPESPRREPARSRSTTRRQQPPRRARSREEELSSRRRPRREEPPRSRGRPAQTGGRGRKPEKRPRKPLGKGARKVLLAFTLLVMVVVTAALCIFLLFKIRTIQVTGDTVYTAADILNLCGFQEGENLVFLSTEGKEEQLEEQLPYIEDAQILRHFPNSLEIRITGAQVAANVSNGSQWYAVSTSGKILAEISEPMDGVMTVTGLTLQDPVPGKPLQAQDENYQQALDDILNVLRELDSAGDFTSLDLTDLYNITMMYQDRIQFQLGSTLELGYKLDFGLTKVVPELGADETGTLDLSLAPDVKKAYFTATAPEEDSASSTAEEGDSSGGTDASQGTDASGTDAAGAEGSDTGEETTSSQSRGGEIPDTIYTG